MSMIYEGTVSKIEAGPRDWTLIWVKEQTLPLAFKRLEQIPAPGQHISVEANLGTVWAFGEHRSLVIRDKPRPLFVVTDHYPKLKLNGKAGRVAEIILSKFYLEQKKQLTGDDIVKEIAAEFPDNNPRIAGIGFQLLSRKKIIHTVGWARSQYGHHRQNPVWELTRK